MIASTDPNSALQDLEDKLERLIAHYQTVKNEYRLLKTQHDELLAERTLLLEKSTAARLRVEAMIERLKMIGEQAP